jgi:mono/diheme cytochrome c family protein
MLSVVAQAPATAQEQETARGQQVFLHNCTRCHGKHGDKGFLGAKDLTKSSLSPDAAKKIILEGKGFMPSWKKRLTVSEIDLVIRYIVTLRQG